MSIEEIIATEVYLEYQHSSNGLRNCYSACNPGDLDEHMLEKYKKELDAICDTDVKDYTLPNL